MLFLVFLLGSLQRAFEYYQVVLNRARETNNTTEIVYVSEVLSDLFTSVRGDLRQSELVLTAALDAIDANLGVFSNSGDDFAASANPRIDISYLTVQLRLCRCIMDGYYFERAIDMLQELLYVELPPGKESQVLFLLAEAYVRKRWFGDAVEVLCSLASTIEPMSSRRPSSNSNFASSLGEEVDAFHSSLSHSSSSLFSGIR